MLFRGKKRPPAELVKHSCPKSFPIYSEFYTLGAISYRSIFNSCDLYGKAGSIMKLRTSKVLKIFAILLFSLESLAPSIFSIPPVPLKLVKFSSFEKTFTSHSLFLSLYAEECDTEERVDANERQIILFTDLVADEHSLKFSDIATHSFFLTRQQRCKSTPPLFEIHCTYLI